MTPLQVAAVAPRRRSLRWLRAAIPFAVLVMFWLGTLVAHAGQEPDLDEPGTLSPAGTGEHGSSHLAALLRSRGVDILRVTSSAEARQAAMGTDATVFVPTPDYLDPTFLTQIATSGHRRVVVVQPGLRTMIFGRLPIAPAGDAWATRTVPPGCGAAALASLGPAAALNARYVFSRVNPNQRQSLNCYLGGVLGITDGDTETVYVGATDPFRNDRVDEAANQALATVLLGQSSRLVWVDVHAKEPNPADVKLPRITLPEYRRGNQDRTNTGFPIIDALPAWLWAGLLLALAAALLFAVARARRLGPPVAEPLPVVIPASEAVTGRGRLYERINARAATLEALRAAAIARMAAVLNPYGGQPTDLARTGGGARELIAQVAEHTGTPPNQVEAILYGSSPTSDAELTRAVASLDALTAAVLNGAPRHHATASQQPPGGNP